MPEDAFSTKEVNRKAKSNQKEYREQTKRKKESFSLIRAFRSFSQRRTKQTFFSTIFSYSKAKRKERKRVLPTQILILTH